LLVIFSSVCHAQNNLNSRGQAYGHWKFDKATYGAISEGDYKIVSIVQYDSAHYEQEEGSTIGHLDLKYKAGKAAIVTYNFDGDSACVNDGTWNDYDTATGKLMQSTVYYNGIVLERKEYATTGDLLKYSYTNYDADSVVYLTYLDHRVFKKECYPPHNGNNKITQYYPAEPLHLSNAEPELNVNFLAKPSARATITLVADTDVTIKDISMREDIKIVNKKNQPLQFPLELSKGKAYSISIVCTPKPATYSFYDTIAIATAGKHFTYKIICTEWCAHIDRNNVTVLQNVKLSKSKDKYFFIKGCGSVTNFSITDDDGKVSNYAALGGRVTAVDLSEYAPGIYSVDVSMNDCETEGNSINLKIVE